MQGSMLTNEQHQLLLDEKEALTGLLLKLAELEVPNDALANLKKAILQLDELFLIVVVGEFNAGKSALINAILGEKVLSEGVTPTTSRVTLLKWGEQSGEKILDEGFSIHTYPLPLLKEVNIVDSPGTNAIIRQHERLTDEYVPRSDLVLFVTSADRPLTESERQFLERILTWGKKVVFVLNKIDILEDEITLGEVCSFITGHISAVMGDIPELFPVSARLAQRAMAESDEETRLRLRSDSRLDILEQYIAGTLDDAQRLRLKFHNPLGVADNLLTQAERTTLAQADEIKEDRETVEALDTTISFYERELQNELPPRLAEVENILQRLELRGMDFFDSTLRLTNIQNLIHGDRVRAQFEKQVLGDMSQQIDEQIQRVIDWLVEKDLREWQQVMSYLQRRQTLNLEHIVGASGNPQANRRRELIETVGKSARSIVESYDRTKEASELASSVETAVAQAALFEVGAVSLGALVTTAVLSTALDVTGLLAAGTLAIIGIFVIPYKRKKAKEDFREKMTRMRTKLQTTLTETFDREAENAIERLKDNVTPYTRFVHSEIEKIAKTDEAIEGMRRSVATLRTRIEAIVK